MLTCMTCKKISITCNVKAKVEAFVEDEDGGVLVPRVLVPGVAADDLPGRKFDLPTQLFYHLVPGGVIPLRLAAPAARGAPP